MKIDGKSKKLSVEELEKRVAPMAGIVQDPGSTEPLGGGGDGGCQPSGESGVCGGGVVSPVSTASGGGGRRDRIRTKIY